MLGFIVTLRLRSLLWRLEGCEDWFNTLGVKRLDVGCWWFVSLWEWHWIEMGLLGFVLIC